MAEEYIAGRNSILEALNSGRSINRILMAKGERQGSILQILALAKEKGLVVQEVDKARLDVLTGGLRHQGVAASVAPVDYVELDEIIARASEQGEQAFLVLLDELEDPHNVGAILRTAEAAGVHGVLMPKRRSCPLSGTVAKTSAGAVEYVPVARIGNVVQTIKQLQKQGFWVVGADMSGGNDFFEEDLSGPIVIVIGSEGQGLGRLVKESCDLLVRIPMQGKISSLNASVACSLLLYEVLKQRRVKAK